MFNIIKPWGNANEIKMTIILKLIIPKCEDMEQLELSYPAGGNVN